MSLSEEDFLVAFEVYRHELALDVPTGDKEDGLVVQPDGLEVDGRALGQPSGRAAALGAPGAQVKPLLARAFLRRSRYVAAFSCVREAMDAGVSQGELADELRQIEKALGPALTALRARIISSRAGVRAER